MHLYLIGYRGCGKTTVGHKLAGALGRQCVDSDTLVVQAAGKTISEIFSQQGEAAFRDLEQAAIENIAAQAGDKSCIVSLGGGAILRTSNEREISRSGKCVWLTGSPQVLWQRISGDDSSAALRPKLTNHDGYKEVEEVLAARAPIYRRMADLTVNTDLRSPDEVVEEILLWAKSMA